MRALLVAGLVFVGSLVFVGQPVVAHNPDCVATSHAAGVDMHWGCFAKEDKEDWNEWCVLTLDYQTWPTYGWVWARFLCDTPYANGNPLH